ncbi:MAG TPA: PLP-dependent aspartate aminotransferase family protein [Gemmatimonadaceae bacterium]|jgi:cystathionine beta-lyase/cystathionine gamma-synthase|nr:PLP-dependent aspartate aminotransferase family protein [Gemmatimonadaceae bacterium]
MARSPRRLGLSTLAVTGGAEQGEADSPVVQPLVQSVNFVQEFGTADGLRYPRYGNAPNAEVVQRRLAMLDGAEAAIVLASGMGATACALLALLRPGDHLLASSWIYGGTRVLFTQEFATMGIDVTLVDPTETRAWRKRMRKETRAIFVESPVNPTCRVLDLRPISYLTKDVGLALVVDSTFASPINFRPLDHGADVVIHSATKYLNGHHDLIGGVVLGTAPYIEEVRQKMAVWGQAPDPFACWLLERGLKTLDVRVRRQNENAARIAAWCAGRKEVRKVHYPGLADHPDHEIARTFMDGFGGMLAIELVGGGRAADRFLRRLRLITHAPSLGGVDSVISEPRFTSHAHLPSDERTALGIPDGFLRLSVGIEDANDLIADIEQALR